MNFLRTRACKPLVRSCRRCKLASSHKRRWH